MGSKTLDAQIFLKYSLFWEYRPMSYSPNLTHAPSFAHNLCNSSLNEQCEGTLNIYISKPF
jgi:hypothetical protein